VKGTMSRDGHFFKGLNIKSVLSVYVLMVFKIFQKLFTNPMQLLTFYLLL
jgi:hypothetical protein